MAGALGKVDWESFNSPDSEVAPDVIFLVRGEDGEFSKIGAHKVLLAGISPMFKRMFYGPMKETKEEIEVKKETSPEVFRAMIDYIYASDPEKVLDKIKSPKTICELYALGDYFDILSLKNKILFYIFHFWPPRSMASCRDLPDQRLIFEITRESLIFTATVARSYIKLFPELGTQLMMRCLKFYLDSTDKNFPEATDDILHELMKVGRSTLQLPGIKSKPSLESSLFLQVGVPWSFSTQTRGGHPMSSGFQNLKASGKFPSYLSKAIA